MAVATAGVQGNLDISRSLHNTINGLCYFMIWWTLVFPMTWLLPWNEQWLPIILHLMGPGGPLTSRESFIKYKGEPAVTLTHNLPAALWSLLIILQLSSSIRKNYPRIHRASGYLHAAISVVMMVSVFPLMQSRGMYFSQHPAVTGLYICQALWLLSSLGFAILAARRRMYQFHRAWMLRHIASGVWVSVQRIGMGIVFPLLELLGSKYGIVLTDWHAKAVFGGATVAAYTWCLLFCEMHLWLGRRKQLKVA